LFKAGCITLAFTHHHHRQILYHFQIFTSVFYEVDGREKAELRQGLVLMFKKNCIVE